MNQLLLLVVFFGMVLAVASLKTMRDQQSNATAATKLSFLPASSQASPVQKNPNETVAFDIMVDPGTNALSLVTVVLQYDSGKLQYVADSFQLNATAFPTLLEGPVTTNPGMFAVKVSIGSDPTKAVNAAVKLGTLSFTAIDGTGGSSTAITYTTQTSALSIAPNDTATENVIATTEPAFIAIAGAGTNPTATTVPSPTDLPQPTDGAVPTDSPTQPPAPTDTQPTPTGIGGGVPTSTAAPSAQPTRPPGGQTKFKAKVIKMLEKRLKKLEERFAKLQEKNKISRGRLRSLEKAVDNAIAKIRRVISSVNRSHKDRDVKKQVKATLKDLLAEYKDLGEKVDTFKEGMKGVAKKKGRSGKDSKTEKHLVQMERHAQNVGMLAENTSNGIDRITTDAQLRLAIDAVKQNAMMIKSESNKAKEAMKAAAEEITSP